MYGMAPVSLARKMHLAMSHWSFVLVFLENLLMLVFWAFIGDRVSRFLCKIL